MRLFNCMKSFVEVVEHNGFSNAARHANLPTSAYSKRVSWLEEYLDVPLLERTTRRMEVTPAGKVYYEDAKRILRQLEDAKQHATETNAEPQGHLKLAMPTSIGRSLVLPKLGEFFTTYPKITIDVVTADAPANVADHLVDVAITVIQSDDSTLVCEPLCTSRRHVYAAPSYLKQHGTPKKLADLTRHQCLINMTTSPKHYWRFSHDQEIKVSGPLYCDGNSDLIVAAVNGMGLIWLADTAVRQEVAAGQLVPVSIGLSDPEVEIFIYHRPAAAKSPIRLLVKYLQRVVL